MIPRVRAVRSYGVMRAAKRIARKLRPAAAAIKTEPFPITQPPRAVSFKRW
jgi:hypothetical protein